MCIINNVLSEVCASEQHKRLFSHMFHLYDFRVIPVEFATDPMPITVENIKLKRILDIVIISRNIYLTFKFEIRIVGRRQRYCRYWFMDKHC